MKFLQLAAYFNMTPHGTKGDVPKKYCNVRTEGMEKSHRHFTSDWRVAEVWCNGPSKRRWVHWIMMKYLLTLRPALMLMLPLVKDLICQALKSLSYHQNDCKLTFFRSDSKPSKIKGGSDQAVIALNEGAVIWLLQLMAKRGWSLLKRQKCKYNWVTELACLEGTLERKSQSNISIQIVIQEYLPPMQKQFGPWCCQGIVKNRRAITVSWIQQKHFLKIAFTSSGTVNISLGSPKKGARWWI